MGPLLGRESDEIGQLIICVGDNEATLSHELNLVAEPRPELTPKERTTQRQREIGAWKLVGYQDVAFA